MSDVFAEIRAERAKQAESFGHSRAADADLPLFVLPKKVHDFALIADECSRAGAQFDPARARKKLVQTAALAVAAVERFDMEAGRS